MGSVQASAGAVRELLSDIVPSHVLPHRKSLHAMMLMLAVLVDRARLWLARGLGSQFEGCRLLTTEALECAQRAGIVHLRLFTTSCVTFLC